MNIIYLSYWGLEEGLTQSSVIPHIQVLSEMPSVDKVVFLTIERMGVPQVNSYMDKVIHVPLLSKNVPLGIVNKISDFLIFPRQIIQLVKEHDIDQMICRTALGGALGFLVNRKVGLPFMVESFEPHAEYMLEAGVWKKNGLKYRFQKYWEQKVIQHAKHIVTVSRHYAELLRSLHKREVRTFGCAVDLEKFAFNQEQRFTIQKRLGWTENRVGIYVGKFGDIYYDEEAFNIFKSAFDFFGPTFRLIILTPNEKELVLKKLLEEGIQEQHCFVELVPHEEVTDYLSASDFAFSMVRPAPVRLYCSPIKDGEYWANGLPVLSADQIGEDSEIIKEERAGAIFNEEGSNLLEAFKTIEELISTQERTGHIRQVAKKYRNFAGLIHLYITLLK